MSADCAPQSPATSAAKARTVPSTLVTASSVLGSSSLLRSITATPMPACVSRCSYDTLNPAAAASTPLSCDMTLGRSGWMWTRRDGERSEWTDTFGRFTLPRTAPSVR